MTIPTATNDRVRSNIETVRRVRGITGQQLADEGGWGSRQIVSDRLVGRTKITVDELAAFAKVLGVPMAVLLEPMDFVFRYLGENGQPTKIVAEMKRPTRKRTAAKTPAKRGR